MNDCAKCAAKTAKIATLEKQLKQWGERWATLALKIQNSIERSESTAAIGNHTPSEYNKLLGSAQSYRNVLSLMGETQPKKQAYQRKNNSPKRWFQL